MIGNREKTGKLKYFMVILFVMVLVSSTLVARLLARYSAISENDDGARVASFNITETGIYGMDISTSKFFPGYVHELPINIVNNSEVAVNYSLYLTTTGNLPLVFEMVDEEGNIVEDDKAGDAVQTVAAEDDTTDEDEETPQKNTKIYEFNKRLNAGGDSRNYKLNIVWPAENSSTDYIRMVDYIKVSVDVVQID